MPKITITAWLAIFDPFWTMINLLIFYDLFPGNGDVWYGKKEDVFFRCQAMSFHPFPAEMIWSSGPDAGHPLQFLKWTNTQVKDDLPIQNGDVFSITLSEITRG